MLEAVNLPSPKKVFTTWFFTVDWQKMSKSLWNVIDPIQLLEKYGRDAISLYLFYDIKIWKDGDFSFARFEDVYNNILIGGWWNLVYRISKLGEKFNIKKWELANLDELNSVKSNEFIKAILDKNIEKVIEKYFDQVDYQAYLKIWYELIQETNKFIQDTAPWKIIKEDEEKWKAILESAVWLIHKINLLWSFFFIESFEKINKIFDFTNIDNSKNFDTYLEEIYKTKLDINSKPEIVFKKLEAWNLKRSAK
jgi:methionyl-tRNA synthetase